MTTLAQATGTWRKSSYSNNGDGGCVGMAWFSSELRGIRDLKEGPDGAVLPFHGTAVDAFIRWATTNQL